MRNMTYLLRLSIGVLWLFTIVGAFRRYDDQISITIAEKGKKQLNELEQKSHLPRYGECWLQALVHLQDGCQMLTESIQVDLALHFTNCFMEMSGQERLDCVSERTEGLKRLCMSEMSDRAFAVYTEFFTQTQNMCFFLQSQSWQLEVDRTVDRLSVKSREVSERLEVAGEVQRVVLEHQKEGLKLQGEMLELGGSLARTLNGSQNTLDKLTGDLKSTTQEHQAVLKDLFREFYLLHSWIVGRYAFVDRLVFYVSFLLVVMVATSTKRTANCRVYLILNILISIVVETSLQKILPSMDTLQRDQIHWSIRKLFAIFGLFTLVYFSYHYKDLNTKLLNEIKEQNRQIMDSILRLKIEASGWATTATQNRENEEKESESTFSFSVAQTDSRRSIFDSNFERIRPRHPAPNVPLELETTTDYEKENSSNERRSASRSVKQSPARRTDRAPSHTSESSVSRASRYNLRRKTTNYNS